MHLSPLTGIETATNKHTIVFEPDASFTPYGDWNDPIHCNWWFYQRCIFHPLRGLKRLFHRHRDGSTYDASFTPYGDWNDLVTTGLMTKNRCIFHPLRGLKHRMSGNGCIHFLWCIFHPLRGLKPRHVDQIQQKRELMHLSPLTGIETLLFFLNLIRRLFDASFTPYGDWNRSFWSNGVDVVMHLSPLTGIETWWAMPSLRIASLMHLSPLTGIETICS